MRILRRIKNRALIIFYNIPRFLFINYYKYCVVRIRVFDPRKIPRENSAIFAFNHTTGADPIIVLGAIKRKIYFLTDSDRFKTKFTEFFFRKFTNSIPVFKNEMEKNIKSFKELFSISRGKKIFFGVFPEGNLIKDGFFGKFKDGAAYLSYKTKIPIIPVYIHNIHKGPEPDTWCGRHPVMEGIYSLFSNTFRRINVFIGEPIDPVAEAIESDFKEFTDKNSYKRIIEKITAELEEEFNELKEEADNLFKTRKTKLITEAHSGSDKKPSQRNFSIKAEQQTPVKEIDEDVAGEDLAENTGSLK